MCHSMKFSITVSPVHFELNIEWICYYSFFVFITVVVISVGLKKIHMTSQLFLTLIAVFKGKIGH